MSNPIVSLDDLIEKNDDIDALVKSLDDLIEVPAKKKKSKVRHIDEWNLPAPFVPKWEAVGVTMRVVRQICQCGEGHYRQTGLFVHYREEHGAEKWSRVTRDAVAEARFRELDHFTEITEESIDVCMCCFESGSILTVHYAHEESDPRQLHIPLEEPSIDITDLIGDPE